MQPKTKNVEDIYPLTPAQQGILFHTLEAPGSGVYVVQLSGRLRGLDSAVFQRAWQRLLERHEALRTAFFWQELQQPLQIVREKVTLPWTEHDWRTLPAAEQDSRWKELLQEDRVRGFDPARAPLMRMTLAKVSDDTHWFVWTHHHLIMDGWSFPLVLREMVALYEAERTGAPLPLPPRRFRDYIAWLVKQDLGKAEEYWRRTLAGFSAPTPVGLVLKGGEAGQGELQVKLSESTTAELNRLARQNGLTLNTVMQGAWAVLLGRYAGQEDVVFGQAVSGRPAGLPGVESMVGMFVNTLPVRVNIGPDLRVRDWLKALQKQQAEQLDYEYSPLVKVQGWSNVPRGTPLFESLLAFENYPADMSLKTATTGFVAEGMVGRQQVNYPLALQVFPGPSLQLNLMYDRGRLDTAAADRLLGHLRILLEGMAANPEQRLGELPLLTSAERLQLLDEFNATQVAYPRDVCLHALIERQVAATPTALAVSFEDTAWTYRELNERSNRLAHRLRSLGVKPDTRVGVCMERSLDLVAALLGVLKAGGAYVPLDPEYPRERLAHMLEDAQVPVLLTHRALVSLLPDQGARLLCLDELWADLESESAANLPSEVGAANLAYVIFTSGSTGRPKGAMNAHRGIVNRLLWMQDEYKLTAADNVLQKTPFSFDVSVWEFFWPLLTGARLVMARPGGHRDAAYLVETIVREKITTLHFVPSMLQAFLEDAGVNRCGAVLRRTICSGEALPFGLQQRFFEYLPNVELHNLYGPTEAAVDVTYWKCRPEYDRAIVPIGRPVANTQMYVLDPRGQAVPLGVPGELHIGGIQVGTGYLNRVELTAEKFIPDPFSCEPNARLYRTGDLARWLPDGAIEYLGRLDHQVKIRGFRIELGEIEAVLARHADVREVVVIAREDTPGDKRLVAYVVPTRTPIRVSDMRSFARASLPDYMVPAAIVVLESLPLSPNGKLDRKALPAPDFTHAGMNREFVAPRTPLEEQIAAIWAGLLKVERVGVHDNFFEIGGDSLLAARAAGRLGSVGEFTVSIREFFDHPTVSGLATHIEKQKSPIDAAPLRLTRRVDHTGPLPLSSSQEGFYFVTKLHPTMPAHHMNGDMQLTGELDIRALEQSFNEVVRRHDALRASFRLENEKPVQIVHAFEPFAIPQIDLSGMPERDRQKAINSICLANRFELFNIPDGPLYRIKLLRLGPREHVILFAVHHIIFDGASFNVLLRELTTLYLAFKAGEPSPLPDLPFQYGDYLLWLQDYLQHQDIEKLKDYFEKKMAKVTPLDLPTDFPRPRGASGKGGSLRIEVPVELGDAIRRFHAQSGVTPFMTLLAAYQIVLQLFSGQDYIYISSPTDNRMPSETEALIGCFTKMLHLNTDVGGDPSFAEVVERDRDDVLEAYEKQVMPIQVLRAALNNNQAPEWNRQRNLGVLFTMQNFMDNKGATQQRPDAAFADLQVAPLRLDLAVVDAVLLADSNKKQGPRARDVQVADLALNFRYEDGVFVGDLNYRADLFRPETIERIRDYFLRALKSGLEAPTRKLSELPILNEAERQWLLSRWQPLPELEKGANRWVHRLVEERAAQAPNSVAVVLGVRQLTYGELNSRANQFANFLSCQDIDLDRPVAVFMDDSLDALVVVLGVLKAGGCYLPLDPNLGDERVSSILRDAQPALLVTESSLQGRLVEVGTLSILLDKAADEIARQPSANPTIELAVDAPAYVVYSPDSRGDWNGVRIGHSSFLNAYRAWEAEYHLRDEVHALMQLANFASDGFAADWVQALCSGAKLVLCPRAFLSNPEQIYELMQRERVDAVEMVPVVLRQFMAYLHDAHKRLDFLRLLVVHSDSWYVRELVELKKLCGGTTRIIGSFGFPETTIASSFCDDGAADQPLNALVPIGKPFPSTQFYVLDQYMRLSPIDVWGELHVGGTGVARDYWNRPQLTAERFVANPFDGQPGSRLFKTGCQARWRSSGRMEIKGPVGGLSDANHLRLDAGPALLALKQHRQISDAVTVVRKESGDDEAKVIAYIVPRAGATLALHEIRSYLSRQELPRQSIPAAFVSLPSLPLAVNGKLDLQALPEPNAAELLAPAGYVAPTTPMEERLCAIIGETLGVERVGIYDDFFAMGGDSMSAMQIAMKAREEFGVENVPITGLFVAPNVAELSARIAAAPKADPADESEPKPDPQAEETGRPDPDEADGLEELAYRHVRLDSSRLPLVPLQMGGSKAPFFIVHGIDGSVSPFAKLAQEFAPDRPVLGLQARGLYYLGAPIERIEEMAAYYCAAVRAEQPRGPYFLGGWSMGGMVALEMAKQLSAPGAEVGLVVLFDPFFPTARAKRNLVHLLQQDDAAMLATAFPKLFSDLGVPVRRFKAMTSEQRSEIIWNKFEQINARLLKMDLATVNSMLLTRRAHSRALSSYQPSSYPGPTLFLEAGGKRISAIAPWTPSSNWLQLLPSVKSYIVPGGHRGMLSGGNAGGLADVIKAAFTAHEKAKPE